jgi:peptide/nickel transport system ATP-binding protein
MLDVRNLTTVFDTEAGPLTAVDDVSFAVARGEILGLVGESGSGKSVTCFSIVGLVDRPGRVARGEILFDGTDLRGLPEAQMRRIRGRRIAFVFQDPMMTLNPVLRIEVQMVEQLHAHFDMSRTAARDRAREALASVGISAPEARLRSYPHELSGGMRQRVALAMAFQMEPDLIIADEPTTALDVTIQSQILSIAQDLATRKGCALVWVTHDLSVVAGLADRIAVMYAGRLVETGPTDIVIGRPSHPYTVGLVGSVPSRNRRGEALAQIPGGLPSPLAPPPGCNFRPRCGRATDACAAPPGLVEHDGRQVRCFHPVAAEEPVV